VVVRYFGGIKLGTSGLIAAYREAAADAIVNAEIIEKYVCFTCEINFQYTVMNDVMRIVKQAECEIINQNFENDCHMMLAVRKNKWEEMHSALSKIETVLLMKIVEK
jgi:putative IMPACT (imprinted ancient) family translation regulator